MLQRFTNTKSVVDGVATPSISDIDGTNIGTEVTFLMTTEGPSPFYCENHYNSGMYGVVYVGDGCAAAPVTAPVSAPAAPMAPTAAPVAAPVKAPVKASSGTQITHINQYDYSFSRKGTIINRTDIFIFVFILSFIFRL